MDWQARIVAFVVATALSACSQHHQVGAQAETAGPHFANLCIKQSNWPRVINYMKKYGNDHGLEFHGGIDTITPDGRPLLNAYLAQGYSYYFGDDFDMWFVSDPFRVDVVTLGGIVKKQPISLDQQRLADGILAYIADISSPARGPMENPNCTQVPPSTKVE